MSENFKFLKKINNNLFDIISEAEKLYRDEYFEQCMTQTRRFGEHICKDILKKHNQQTGSFDEMLATLQDNSNGNIQEKEFIDDLYFLKKNGNESVHSGKIKKDGMVALECLKRAFEVAINYSVYANGACADILKLNYDVELLITGNKSKKSLKEKYEEAKSQSGIDYKKDSLAKTKKEKIKSNNIKKEKIPQIKLSLFWKFVFCLFVISILTIVFLSVAILLQK